MEQKVVFKKIEDVLYAYTKYKKRIQIELEELRDLQIKKSYKLGNIHSNAYEIKSELEQLEELRDRILNNIKRYNEILFRIDECLNLVIDHKDYCFIKLKYFDNLTYEAIAEKLEINVSNTYKMRGRILGALEIHMLAQTLISF